jgi:CHAD domain-containing protein
MGYSISTKETLPDAARRIVVEQLEKAIEGLADEREPVVGVHTARKSLKRVRAVLRLLRRGLPREFFQDQNFFFRDAGQLLSPLRDLHVQREALGKLQIPGSTVALSFGNTLAREEAALSLDRDVRTKASRLLSKARDEVAHWPLQDLTRAAVSSGLRNIYKKVRRAYVLAQADPSPENLHEWRKRTKDLWYSLELLGELRTRRLNKICRRTKRLSDYLGQDHDYFFLLENLRRQPLARPRIELHRLGRILERKSAKLQRCALRLGERTFAEKPRQMAKRIADELNTK